MEMIKVCEYLKGFLSMHKLIKSQVLKNQFMQHYNIIHQFALKLACPFFPVKISTINRTGSKYLKSEMEANLN